LPAGLPIAERRLQLNGVSTAILEAGDGPPVVLLHGPGGYAALWLGVIQNLSTTHRVIAPDLPSHGASEAIEGPVFDRMLGWLDELIDYAGPMKPVLVGQVLGGGIALPFAARRTERVSRLILVDALGLRAFQPAPEFGRALNEFLLGPTDDAHDRLWNRCVFDYDAFRSRLGERWEWIKAYNLDRARAADLQPGLHRLMEEFGMPAIPPSDLARIAVPTFLIWGRHDPATPLGVAQTASTAYGWPLQVIENSGTEPPIEQPEAFLDAFHAALGDPR
jgi:pimeloyl-ACP methyl ester carboxylesterase